MENWMLVSGVVVVAIAALAFALVTARAIYLGASIFLSWALEQGFIGIAAFAACWFFMLPVTVIACAVVGFGVLLVQREERQAETLRREIPLTRQRLGLDP